MALATVVKVSGSVPQQPGAKILVTEEGEISGTVGGGAIEARVISDLKAALIHGRSKMMSYDLGRDLGMCCGGRMELFVEPMFPTERLFIFGAGHVSKPTAQLATMAGFDVTVIDDRVELLTEERFPNCTLLRGDPADAKDLFTSTASDWLLIVTHDHRLDEEALDTFSRLPHRYIGMIGSKRKVFRILQRIHHRSVLPDLSRVYAPVGISIGAVTPQEIAVSVLAELVALRRGSKADHLRAVEHPLLREILEGKRTPEQAALLDEHSRDLKEPG